MRPRIHSKKKVEKLFLFLEKGGKIAEAARIFTISRVHIYRLIEVRENALEAEILNPDPNPDAYSNIEIEGRLCRFCVGCNWPFLFPPDASFIENICSEMCCELVAALPEKTEVQVLALAETRLPNAVFAVSPQQREASEAKRKRRLEQRAVKKQKKIDDVNDMSDLIE